MPRRRADFLGLRITSSMPVADELRYIRQRSAELAGHLGYKAVAKGIRSGGPLESNLRFIRNTLHGRKYSNPVSSAEKGINEKVMALEQGLDVLLRRIRDLGSK